jgi:hypothetical protein
MLYELHEFKKNQVLINKGVYFANYKWQIIYNAFFFKMITVIKLN